MGKKSIWDGSSQDAFEEVNVPPEMRDVRPMYRVEDPQALFLQMLKNAQPAQRKQALLVYYNYYYQ